MSARVSVFIGWSGPRSRAVALALADWLPQVIQAVTPWVSEDMDRGAQWFATIGTHLKTADYGLLCVTPENATEPWVLFEAGALAVRTSERLACPYLLDMTPAELAGPLGQLQAATANREGTLQVVETINRLLDDGIRLLPEQLNRAFDRWWDELESKLEEARHIVAAPAAAPARDLDDKLDEVLEIVRGLQRSETRGPDAGLLTSAASSAGAINLNSLQNLGLSALRPDFGSISPEVLSRLGKISLLSVEQPPPQEPGSAQPPKRTVRAKVGKPKKP